MKPTTRSAKHAWSVSFKLEIMKLYEEDYSLNMLLFSGKSHLDDSSDETRG